VRTFGGDCLRVFKRERLARPLLMQPPPAYAPTAIPGMRIPNYRNSAQRAIRLIGLGAAASELVNRVGERGLSNVAIMTRNAPIGWPAVTGETPDRDLNMIVIVCHEGDADLFQPAAGRRPDVLVTFVVLQREGHLVTVREAETSPDLERARAFCDLFVTTSHTDYVSELIDNLAS
jgi:hypothetical protein